VQRNADLTKRVRATVWPDFRHAQPDSGSRQSSRCRLASTRRRTRCRDITVYKLFIRTGLSAIEEGGDGNYHFCSTTVATISCWWIGAQRHADRSGPDEIAVGRRCQRPS
jgi:hypothetical protein